MTRAQKAGMTQDAEGFVECLLWYETVGLVVVLVSVESKESHSFGNSVVLSYCT